MAKLVYDDTGRLLFTKEMKEEYTILMPQMLPVHFGMFQRLLELEGYKVDMLTSNPNIVCTQPFGCLPNHIVGKGMLRKLKVDYPYSNVVAIDYDPGATKINQENRIKLMLANAKALAKQQGGEAPAAAREAAPTPSSYTHAGAHA